MDTTNFDIFNRISLYVLVKSFEEFPNYIEVDPSTVGFDAIMMKDEESYEEAWDLLQISKSTIDWLVEENFLNQKLNGRDKVELRLSLKGLTLVGYGAPSNTTKFSSFKDSAVDVLKSGTNSAVSDVLKGLLVSAYTAVPALIS